MSAHSVPSSLKRHTVTRNNTDLGASARWLPLEQTESPPLPAAAPHGGIMATNAWVLPQGLEVRLWQAVIVTTIQEWISGPLRSKRQAEEYLFQDQKDFPLVCQSAGLDPARLRTKLNRLRTPNSQSRPQPK